MNRRDSQNKSSGNRDCEARSTSLCIQNTRRSSSKAMVDLVGIEPNPGPKVSKRVNKQRSGTNVAASDRWIQNSNPGAVRALIERNPLDLILRPPSMSITQSPPPGFQKKVTWLQSSLLFTANFSTTNNWYANSFALSDIPTLAAFAVSFDQYCIYAVKVRFLPKATTSVVGQFGSVIDFDNAVQPTSWQQLEDYGNFMSMSLVQGCCQERFIKPCVTPLVYNGAGTGFATARSWIDSANTGVPHYGVRYGIDNGGPLIALQVGVEMTYVIGFRNNI